MPPGGTHGEAGVGGTAAGAPGLGGSTSGAAGRVNSAAGAGQTGASAGTGGTGGTGGGAAQSGGANAGGNGGKAPAGAGQGGAAAGGPTGGAPAAGGNTTAGTAGSGAGAANAGTGGTGGGTLVAPPWDDVPMCTASKTDTAGQGPFIIHELEKDDDISMIRQDIRGRYDESAEPGLEMQLHLRVLDSTSTDCNGKPVSDIDVYIWHTDAQGYYSGFGKRGTSDEQKPDEPYSGTPGSNNLENTDRFLRGVQRTDANGVVSFRSIFPGWYNGRDLHIHFVAFKKDSTSAGRVNYTAANSGGKWLFTTQFYFDPTFSKSIHEKNQPYLRRTTLSAYAGAMAADESGNSGLHAKASLAGDTDGVGGIVTAQMQIVLDPKA